MIFVFLIIADNMYPRRENLENINLSINLLPSSNEYIPFICGFDRYML